jgi:hypothetical protein
MINEQLLKTLKKLLISWSVNQEDLFHEGDVFSCCHDFKQGLFFETEIGFFLVNKVFMRLIDNKRKFELFEARFYIDNKLTAFLSKNNFELIATDVTMEEVKEISHYNSGIFSKEQSKEFLAKFENLTFIEA